MRLRRRLGGPSLRGGRNWRRLDRQRCRRRHPLVIVIAKIPQPQEDQQKKNLTQSNRGNGKRPDCSENTKTGQSHKLTRYSPSSHHPPSSTPTSVPAARFRPQSCLKCYLCPDRAPPRARKFPSAGRANNSRGWAHVSRGSNYGQAADRSDVAKRQKLGQKARGKA